MDLSVFTCCIPRANGEIKAPTVKSLFSEEADAVFLLTTQDSSDFTESGSTSRSVINMQPNINTKSKLEEVRTIIVLQRDHPDLEGLDVGGTHTLQQRLRAEGI